MRINALSDLNLNQYVKYFLACTLFCIAVRSFGQEAISPNTGEKKDESQKNEKLILPVLIFSPETDFGFGALGVYLWHFKKEQMPTTRTSNAELALLYTTRNQLIALPKYTIFTNREKYLFDGLIELLRFSELYYGVGSETPDEDEENVEFNLIAWEGKFQRQILPKLFFGFEARYFNRFDVRSEDTGVLRTTEFTGFDGSVSIGLGPALTFDKRDNVLNPSKGFFLDARATFHRRGLGGTVNFNRYLVDYRKYFKILPNHRHILAFNAFGFFVTGDAPFKQLAEIGGPRILRGYFRGRFRDNHLWTAQGEYRFPIYKIIGATVFGGVGEVADRVRNFGNEIRPSYGVGLRVQVNKREKLNIRFDYGRGSDGNDGFYLSFAEAF